jgi:cytochrome c biogenesis protein CcmG/thiol:disulfide interchange protein DsbE
VTEPLGEAVAGTDGGESAEETRRSRRRVAPVGAGAVAVVLAVLFWFLVQAEPGSGTTADSPLLGRPAPEAVSTTTTGEPFDLSRRKGSFVVLNFFNSTCVPCVREHPELVEFERRQQQLGADGAELYTVIWDDREDAVEGFFDSNGGDWPRVRDPDGTIGVTFGVARVPETWIVDPNGFVRVRILGELTADFLEERLDLLAAGTPS